MTKEKPGMEELENEIRAMRRIVNALETVPEDRRIGLLDYVRCMITNTNEEIAENASDNTP